jgi:hypothetical protein
MNKGKGQGSLAAMFPRVVKTELIKDGLMGTEGKTQ